MTDKRIEAIGYLNQYCDGDNFCLAGEDAICCYHPNIATRQKIELMSHMCEINPFPEMYRGILQLSIGEDLSGLKTRAEHEPRRKSNLAATIADLNTAFGNAGVTLNFDGEFTRSGYIPSFDRNDKKIRGTLEGLRSATAVEDYIIDFHNKSVTIRDADPDKLKTYLASSAQSFVLALGRPADKQAQAQPK